MSRMITAVKPHHASEKMPVSEVHIHLFLQLVNTALSQYPAIYVCLSENRNKMFRCSEFLLISSQLRRGRPQSSGHSPCSTVSCSAATQTAWPFLSVKHFSETNHTSGPTSLSHVSTCSVLGSNKTINFAFQIWETMNMNMGGSWEGKWFLSCECVSCPQDLNEVCVSNEPTHHLQWIKNAQILTFQSTRLRIK